MPHGDHYGVHGDVHHDNVEHLQANAEVSNSNNVEASGADGEGLEEAIEDTESGREACHGGVVQVEELKGKPVDAVEAEDHKEQPAGGGGGEEVGVDTTRVFEYEAWGWRLEWM